MQQVLKTVALGLVLLVNAAIAQSRIGRYEVFETSFQGSGAYANPYLDVRAEATLTRPDGAVWRIPLFWDGEKTWKMRVSPDVLGTWSYRISSTDPGLDGRSGQLLCVASEHPGGIQASTRWPSHFERQNGSPFWFMGDTAWAYFTDIPETKYTRAAAEDYAKTRASQGFNVIHSMMLFEGGVGNRKGLPFRNIAEEQINPSYWQEVDDRLAFANRQGLTVGLAIAWGDKRTKEPFAWRRFPSLTARKRYARYVAARYSAYNVYFLVSGEWNGEVRTRGNVSFDQVFEEFVEIGDSLAAAEPHHRMIGIHPMTSYGSVREFTSAPWMSFADYQQNYEELHARVLVSRSLRGPVVNSEYGYFLRDQDGDGKPDKPNSYSAEDMRFASWDIVMAGGYLVTGFGTTYFGGLRDPGPFDLHAAKNREWEQQIRFIKTLFEPLAWWRLGPADELISSSAPRTDDRRNTVQGGQRPIRELHPPKTTYWALASPGEFYIAYVRGTTAPIQLELGARPQTFHIRQYNPRTGEFRSLGEAPLTDKFQFTPPDEQDWVMLLEAVR